MLHTLFFLYDEGTDWYFIYSIAETGNDFDLLLLGWAKFGRSYIGIVLVTIFSFAVSAKAGTSALADTVPLSPDNGQAVQLNVCVA